MHADKHPLGAPDEAITRADLRALFHAALREPTFNGKVYHLIGRGGIGKSHELRLLHEQALALHEEDGLPLIETGIIDLAHTRYQQPLLLMGTLARRLTRSLSGNANTPDYFDSFFQAVDRYLKLGDVARETSQRAVRRAFLESYRATTAGHRVLITFDTFERLDPRIPELDPYNFRGPARLETWLLDLLAELDNSLTVVAGRDRPRQAAELQRRLGSKFARRLALKPFTAEETKDFIERQVIPDERRDLDWYERMYTLSGGLPVRLIVALEIARACDFDPDQLPPSLSDPRPDNMQQLGKDFVQFFVASLYNSDPALAQLIEQAYYLRKGLYPELLRFIGKVEENSDEAAQLDELLKTFRSFGFVKVSGDDVLTFHDDVYELLRDQLARTSADAWYAAAIEFLDQEQARLEEQIGNDGMTIERLGRLRMSQIDRLYYQLSRIPILRGYQNYCELSYSAIFARDEEFDMQLQDELARFFNPANPDGQSYRKRLQQEDYSWEQICSDEAVRWVFRREHAVMSDNDMLPLASELADAVKAGFQAQFANDALLRCALETVRLETLGFSASTPEETDEIITRYATVTETLAAIEAETEAAEEQRPIQAYRRQQSRFLRAYALNNWGYCERRWTHLDTAITHYTAAIELYKALGAETAILRATSLNNLGYALYLQGDPELGLICSQEALALQSKAGARYREAMALNTQGRLLLEMDDILGAQRAIERARALLEDFPGTRNDALVALHEGQLARWMGYRLRDEQGQSEAAFARALERYEAAKAYFDGQRGEPDRKAEVRQGLGCTYRSRGYVRQLRGEAVDGDMKRARRYFRDALALLSPNRRAFIASIHEDIAVSYVHQARYTDALAALDEAEAYIPPAFTVRPRAGPVETAESREQHGFWLVRARVELQRAICGLGLNDEEAACTAFLRTFACLLRFSPRAPQLRTFRIVAREYLLERYRASSGGAAALHALRQRTYLSSQRLGTREAFFELEQIFDAAERLLKLL